MSRKMTNSEAIANLNHIYGIVSPDIQRSLDLAIKVLKERSQGDLISRSEAEKLGATCLARRNENGQLEAIISLDNAPTVEINTNDIEYKAYCKGLEDGKKIVRSQGECKSCIHRDPEDKKCDCGGQERQGCLFPVSDDYYCKYYEKGGAE